MFSFTLDRRFFFDRETWNDSWYAYTAPAQPPIRHGYFASADGQFLGHVDESNTLDSAEIREIEVFLRDNAESMDAAQFAPHLERPSHYRRINPASNRYSDVVQRMRVFGEWDVNTSVALDAMTAENPAYRLTREFVREMLERASSVTTQEHDDWLRDVAMDGWTYDEVDPRPPFEDYFEERKAAIYRPDYDKKFKSDTQELYTIDGLPTLYYFHETSAVTGFDPTVDSCHFVELDSVVAPVPLGSHGGAAYYIL